MDFSLETIIALSALQLVLGGVIWRFATKISNLEMELMSLKISGIADLKAQFVLFRSEFHDFRTLVEKKLLGPL